MSTVRVISSAGKRAMPGAACMLRSRGRCGIWAWRMRAHPATLATTGGECSVEREDGLDADVQAGDVERLEHDLQRLR